VAASDVVATVLGQAMKQIGEVEEVRFHLYRGKLFAFDLKWWYDYAKTQAAVIISARGAIKTKDTSDAAIIVAFAPVLGPETNWVQIRLTVAQTLAITAKGGYLEVEASTSGDTKLLVRGPVQIYQEVSE